MMPPTLVCNNCGADNQSQATYCRSCGHSLQAAKPTIYHSATGQLLAKSMLKQRYRIIAPIGTGGMGAVYQAEDTQLGNRKVAIKEMSQNGLSPQEQKKAADAFRQEAIILARLQHHNLPSIFDHFEENGRWYLVMSFIEGETLTDYLSRAQGGKLPLDEVVQIGIQLCTMLGYLHTQQPAIIFRDLKPSNIMRTPDGHLYLIDFGIARHFKPGQAKDTAYYGSMGYAPPEQYGRAQTTPRSDIYSLGVVLYEMLSGQDPSTTPFQFPSLQSQIPSIPTELATLITQMLELNENSRPASVLIVSQKLQSLAASPGNRVLPAPLPPAVAAGSPPPPQSPIGGPSPPRRLVRAPQRSMYRTPGIVLLVLLIPIAIIASIMVHSAVSSPIGYPAITSTSLTSPTQTSVSQKILCQAGWSKGVNGWLGSSDWSVINGQLANDGSRDIYSPTTVPTIVAPCQLDNTPDYAVEAKIQVISNLSNYPGFGIFVRSTPDGQGGYLMGPHTEQADTPLRTLAVARSTSWLSPIQDVSLNLDNSWHTYRFEIKGNHLRVLIDGNVYLDATDNTTSAGGRVGLWDSDIKLAVSNFTVYEL